MTHTKTLSMLLSYNTASVKLALYFGMEHSSFGGDSVPCGSC